MNKVYVAVLALMMATTLSAQDTTMVSVPKNMLTPQQVTQIQAVSTVQSVGKLAGVGREIGEAVNTSLQAITTNAETFSQTGVGKLTVGLVIWKVIGKEVLAVLFALFAWLVCLPIIVWLMWKNGMDKRVLDKETLNEAGKVVDRQYKTVHGSPDALFAYTGIAIGTVIIPVVIMLNV